MPLEIYYTPRAKTTLKLINIVINERFGTASANKFAIKLAKSLKLLSANPLMFKSSTIDDTVRVAFITKQTSLFYHIKETEIELLYFWDNRQDPQFSWPIR